MADQSFQIKVPLAWLPAGLISWYAPGGLSVALVTSWVALVGGSKPRIRTVWYGQHDLLSRFWAGGDFVLNVPREDCLKKIRHVMTQGRLCVNAEAELGLACASGFVALAPRLLDCAVQIECVGGTLVDAGFDVELCGEVVRVHRGQVVVDPADIPDLCAILPLCPLTGS